MQEASEALLAGSGRPGDQHRRVDRSDAPREVEDLAHRQAARDHAGVLVDAEVLVGENPPPRSQLALQLAQGPAHTHEGVVELALLEVAELFVIAELEHALAGVTAHATQRVAMADAGGLDAVDRAAVGAAEVAARKATQRPAHADLGLAKVQQVLLGLIGLAPDRLGKGRGVGALAGVYGFEGHGALETVQASPRTSPFFDARPRKAALEALGCAPAVRVAEAGHDPARDIEAQLGDQLLAQQPERDGVEQQRALACEAQDASVGLELEQLVEHEVAEAHQNECIILVLFQIKLSRSDINPF